MPRNQDFWTDERVALLRSLWADQRNTCEAIAAAVGGGATAASVSGKAHRLGLSLRAQSYTGHSGRRFA